ncbi:MAG: peptide-N-glycosidase F-related protein, partial [Bacteroidia bacterium]
MKLSTFKFKATLIMVILFELISNTSKANPGDTTWVTIYNLRKLTYYGNYDTTASMPTTGQYRKIRLHYILSTYACPGGTQYCGSWDYTTQIYAKPANNDTVEIARVITPYATDWIQTNRTHDYIIDVTDYASVLKGNTDFRFVYQGYSYGFAITLKLEYIEGTPAMDALKVKNIYDGYFAYGKTADSIEKHLIPKTMSYANPGSRAMIKNIVSGHGSDDTQCSEFCSKYYQLKLNNSQIAQYQIWRNDCGSNNVYPQTGTWLYERANWCPGAVVWPVYHDITPLTAANTN